MLKNRLSKFRILQILPVLVVILAVNPERSSAQDGAYLTGNLTPGPYEVGLHVYHEYDYSRTYAPGYDENAETLRSASPRPMQIAVWFPARKAAGAAYMELRDYVYLDETVEEFGNVPDDTRKLEIDQAFQYQNIFTGPSDPDILHRTLSLETRTLADAEPIQGDFPLIVYSPREYRGVYYNTQLIEYLVSHGFVVAATPNKDRLSATRQSQTNPDILLTNMRDLQFVKGFASRLDHVDENRVGVVGWAWGAMPALSMAMNDANISAVVALDGNFRFPNTLTLASGVPNFAAANLNAAFMAIEPIDPQFGGPPPAADFTLYDGIDYADAFYLRQRDAAWFGMSSFFNVVHGKGANNPTRFDYEAIDRSYDEMLQYTLHFAKAYLTGDENSARFLERSPEQNGVPEGGLEMRSKKGLTPPPTEAFFVQYFLNEGSQKAVALWDRIEDENPGYVISTANGLNGLGYQLVGLGETEEAVEAFKLQTRAYPSSANSWDSMGEGYMANGDDDLAIEAFQKSLSLNPPQFVMDNSISLLDQLGVVYEVPDPMPISGNEASRLTGLYDVPQNNSASVQAEVRFEDGKLITEQAGQAPVELLRYDDNTYYATGPAGRLGITVQFDMEGSGRASAMLLTLPGNAQPVTAPRRAESGTN